MGDTERVLGQPSYRIESDLARAYVTRLGGQVGPISFRLPRGVVSPFHIAPWAEAPPADLPAMLEVLRGDFFCMPFGDSLDRFQREAHPPHGETANGEWSPIRIAPGVLELAMDTTIRPGRVEKRIELRAGQTAIYSRHTIRGMSGPMTFGHHAMLRFQSPGLVSTAPFAYGQAYPLPFEDPVIGGYSCLRAGARFDCLERVPMADGQWADLSQYPAREGFEDLVMVLPPIGTRLGWTSVVFPAEGFLWLSLKDARVLPGTVFWHSNGGRHYSPWNGRHRGVLGIEEVCSWFHAGLPASVADNDIRRAGYRTYWDLSADSTFEISTTMLVAAIPDGFDAVASVSASDGGVEITSRNGSKTTASVDLTWLGV